MTSQFVFAEDKTSKRGNGVNAVLKFMGETIAFNDKLKSCIDAQEDLTVKASLEKYNGTIEELYHALAKVAEGGIKSFSDNPQVEVEEKIERKPVEPAMVNAPSVPKLP